MPLLQSTILLTTTLMLLSPSTALAQDIIGTTVLGGKRVDLLSDGTWKFATSDLSNCVAIHKFVEFCGSIFNWHPISSENVNYTAIFRYDDSNYAGLIIEDIGRADGYNYEFFRRFVIEQAAEVSDVPFEQIPVHSFSDTIIDEKEAETISYGAKIDGVGFVYSNTVFIDEHLTIQAMAWSVGTEFSDLHQEVHKKFIDALKITIEEPVH